MEQRLKQSELELSIIYEHAPVVMILVDEDRRVVKYNRAATEFTRRTENEVIGLRGGEAIRCLNSLDDPNGCGYGPSCKVCVVRNTVVDTLETGRSYHNMEAELPIATNEGKKTFSFLVSTTQLSLQDCKRVLMCIQDITERKHIEEELARRTTILNTIMENTGTMLVYLDRDCNFIMANKAYIDACGHTWEEIKGKNHFSVFPNQENEAIFRNVVDTGEIISFHDKPFEYGDQPWRGISYWDWTLVPVKDNHEVVTGLVLSLFETTDRKEMEQIKDEFIALVSHEMRTPLTVIFGSLEVAIDDMVPIEEKRELMRNAIDSTNNLSDILENMLELSRQQMGRLRLDTEHIDISSIIRVVVNKAMNAGAAQRFQLEIPEALPFIQADPLRVERILNNLIENAVKYSPEDSEIKISVKPDTDFLVTSITDQGKGLPEGIKHKLFQMFERGDNHGIASGTGLGLVVCKRLVEAHGGWIEAESESGDGTTFNFGLPLKIQT